MLKATDLRLTFNPGTPIETQALRGMRYTEVWRYDAEHKRWWVTSGLPDFWAGQ